ncbi:hypothetical protein LEMA_P073400.1 [Plenodomus lingam JN3]|uniref:polynucleotide adenylyltransferase n=1 Tax=Leptosphaeria maculans (strain JN3 / isolate v23.1.3 / race Av1-4-5-6-7-8) TaxID=985895 RepID=E5A806_LEPMJ|nr:hypothetical protein LEMA_P073400.1 [Plenodomus lingam JN3]CBX99751.1 hypothetical protein LEMA_P073400.1 [Plenodomus lingam JN3]
MTDSYRPGDRGRDRPPSLTDRMTFTAGPDHYRPGGSHTAQGHAGNQHQFNFESSYHSTHPAPRFPPTGPANGPSREPPRKRARGGAAQREDRESRRTDRLDHRGRNNANGFRRGGRGGFRKAAPHERALLRPRADTSPERAMGVSDGPNRFLNLDDLSDDEEADMDVESRDSASEDGQVGGQVDGEVDSSDGSNRKIARTQTSNRADGASAPKWSNPDPYTVLPPPDEATGKKTDFVKLIRKAKNLAAEKEAAHNAVAANDDFISFGDDDDAAETPVPPPEQHPLPDRPSDKNDPFSANAFPHSGLSKKKRKHESSGPGILEEWVGRPGMDMTPWLLAPHPYRHLANDPEKWLHNEILDFYDFVAPKPYEHEQRNLLVQRVQSVLGYHRFPQDNGRILCFGSFPAGLYLPTADMDLVYTSDRHFNGGPPVMDVTARNATAPLLKGVRNVLQRRNMAFGAISCIYGAKVPLVKFTDSVTRLQVDISFENLSGMQAQATFAQWKDKYPDMIYMVALLKQFLVMRGLNEVHTGGIGGFAIICLIVHYIHQAGKAENLAELFKGFLDYYGNKFDLTKHRIQMNPMGVVDKTRYGVDNREEKPFGLSIQDPNRPDNNISGGSHKAQEVFKAFAMAHQVLEDRMAASKSGQDIGESILGSVLGGNYQSYIAQRRLMKSLRSPNLLAQLLEKQDDDGVMALAMKYALDTTMSDLPDLPSEGEED